MATEDKKISQLAEKTEGFKESDIAIANPTRSQTQKAKPQALIGAVKADFSWQSDDIYDTDDLVEYIGEVWRSLQNSNTGNVPTENAFWTNEPISEADGITDTQWAAGVFTYDDSKIVYQNAQYYLQVAAPYISSDIDAEIIAGDWDGPSLGQLDQVDFTGSEPSYQNRRIWWDDSNRCPAFYDTISGTSVQMTQEEIKWAVNRTGSTILNGKVVKAGATDGATDLPTITLASATDVNIADILGFTTHDIDDDTIGKVVIFGNVNDIPTDTLSEGAVYLSTIAGEVTNTPALSPDAIVLMGRAEVIDAVNGRIFANVNQAVFPESIPLNDSWSSFSGSITGPNYILNSYYTFESAITPGAGTTMGTANIAYGAHVYFVLGASSADMVVRVAGTSYDDELGRTASDTEDVDTSGGILDDYFETTKKWIGQVTISLFSGTGVLADYGWAKYWDNENQRFVGTGAVWTGRAGSNDSGPNVSFTHHRSTAWTYTGSGAIPPAPTVDMQSEYVTEFQFASGQSFAFKILGLSEIVKGEEDEGLVAWIDITANNAVSDSMVTFNKIG